MKGLLGLAAVVVLAACAHGGTTAPAGAPAAHGVGYVRMDELLRKHPLYRQLAEYDANLEAYSLGAFAPRALASGDELKRREAALQRELEDAAKRTNDQIRAVSEAYQRRENEAIAAALRSSGTEAPGTSVAGVASQMEATARGQLAGVAAQAQRDLDAYRKQLEDGDRKQIEALQSTLAGRADRSYRDKMDELAAQEGELSLKLASADAPERLALRTKLASLALDDAARAEANARLDELDRKQADELAAARNRDAQTLNELQTQLRAGVERDVQHEVTAIRTRSLARLQAREAQLRAQFAPPAGPVLGAAGTPAPDGRPPIASDPRLPAALREKILHLHADYTAAFKAEAAATVASFNRTRDELRKRYEALEGIDADAERSAQNEVAALQRKRRGLYDQMVAQIGHEVERIAAQRGLSVVLSDVAAPAGGVDLTEDAMKDIESLHE